MRYVALACLILAVFCGKAAWAQTVDEPLMGSEATPDTTTTPPDSAMPDGLGGADGIFRILVIGDSLAGGFGAGLARMAQDDEAIEVVNRFNEASGLSRPEFYDWVAAVPKIVIAKDYDAAVVELGLNDRQAIRSGANQLEFRSDAWVEAYKAQAASLADKLLGAGLNVYWLAIPPVADPELEADLRFISNLQKEAVQSKGGHYVDLSKYFLDASGQYTDRGPDETGVDRKLRARDGVTFMRQGNSRFGQLLLAAIKAKEAESGDAQTVANANPQKGISIEVGGNLPKFGQQGLDGEELSFSAAEMKPANLATGQAMASTQGEAPRIHAALGSAADRLFTTGAGAAAPAGRYDDFSMPSVQ